MSRNISPNSRPPLSRGVHKPAMSPLEPGGGSIEENENPDAQVPPLRRRLSMDEDLYYHNIMSSQRRPSQPPPYDPDLFALPAAAAAGDGAKTRGQGKGKATTAAAATTEDDIDEALPGYTNTLQMEAVFSKKHEIENTTKRAEDRRWHDVRVTLNGTALSIYNVKKDWGWGRSRDGPSICPDNPPWMKKAKLEKTYSLLHADAGIAADYKKRRYVIRLRVETDQFLLACIELSTFVKWLQALFAGIDIATPIDDRDFPRDMSIPRVQRIRWYRGQSPARIRDSSPSPSSRRDNEPDERGEGASTRASRSRRGSTVRPTSSASEHVPAIIERPVPREEIERFPIPDDSDSSDSDSDSDDEDENPGLGPRLAHRLSSTSYANISVNPHSGKWFPDHQWTEAHDMLYAKLCFNNLLFRSPRKSNYIISKGKQWFVDWKTGKMVRVLPPTYGEVDYFGPWQVIHTENMRI